MNDLKDWTTRRAPACEPLTGRYVRLEPLDAAIHGDGLFDASSVPDAEERFRWLGNLYPPKSRADFQPWLEEASASRDPLFFVVIDRETGKIGGWQAFMRIDTANGVGEIGNIYWGPVIARTRLATEAFCLFARHIFEDLGYRRFEWKCNDRNEPSKRAALRFGFQFEGVFRQHMVVKGENRDTAWYSILDDEWPGLSKAIEQWLEPANFTIDGRQIRRLEEIKKDGGSQA